MNFKIEKETAKTNKLADALKQLQGEQTILQTALQQMFTQLHTVEEEMGSVNQALINAKRKFSSIQTEAQKRQLKSDFQQDPTAETINNSLKLEGEAAVSAKLKLMSDVMQNESELFFKVIRASELAFTKQKIMENYISNTFENLNYQSLSQQSTGMKSSIAYFNKLVCDTTINLLQKEVDNWEATQLQFNISVQNEVERLRKLYNQLQSLGTFLQREISNMSALIQNNFNLLSKQIINITILYQNDNLITKRRQNITSVFLALVTTIVIACAFKAF